MSVEMSEFLFFLMCLALLGLALMEVLHIMDYAPKIGRSLTLYLGTVLTAWGLLVFVFGLRDQMVPSKYWPVLGLLITIFAFLYLLPRPYRRISHDRYSQLLLVFGLLASFFLGFLYFIDGILLRGS